MKGMDLISIRKVYHVGRLSKGLRPPSGRRSMSLEGPGLSVSVVPSAWVVIAKLGRLPLNALTRRDGKLGRFVDLTGRKESRLSRSAVDAGYLTHARLWRFSYEDPETGDETFSDFMTRAEAEAEMESYEEGEVKEVKGFAATPQLEKAWAKDFDGNIPDPLSIGLLYALEQSTDYDGAWWNEDLDPYRLSAPRGVIFRSKFPEWTSEEIDWSDAPDADSEY